MDHFLLLYQFYCNATFKDPFITSKKTNFYQSQKDVHQNNSSFACLYKCLIIHIRNLKQALNHGLILKKLHRAIKFIQNIWLSLHIDMNIELRKKAKSDFEKDL